MDRTSLRQGILGRQAQYVDGVQGASQGGQGPLVYDPAPLPTTIGSDWAFNASSARFTDLVDEVSLCRRAFSDTEIFGITDAGRASKNTVRPYITSPSRLPRGVGGQAYATLLASALGTPPATWVPASDSRPPSGLVPRS